MQEFNNNSAYIFCLNVFDTNNVKFIDDEVYQGKDIAFYRCNIPHDMVILGFLNQKLVPFFTDSGFPPCEVRKKKSEISGDLEQRESPHCTLKDTWNSLKYLVSISSKIFPPSGNYRTKP